MRCQSSQHALASTRRSCPILLARRSYQCVPHTTTTAATMTKCTACGVEFDYYINSSYFAYFSYVVYVVSTTFAYVTMFPYSCRVCPNLHLCYRCQAQDKGPQPHTPHHKMVAKGTVCHIGITCGGCNKKNFIGKRYRYTPSYLLPAFIQVFHNTAYHPYMHIPTYDPVTCPLRLPTRLPPSQVPVLFQLRLLCRLCPGTHARAHDPSDPDHAPASVHLCGVVFRKTPGFRPQAHPLPGNTELTINARWQRGEGSGKALLWTFKRD